MAIRFGFVSTYPPTQCGLATFTAALRGALTRSGGNVGRVIQLVDAHGTPSPAEVVAQWVSGDRASLVTAIDQLNRCDIAIVQHEFGIFGGPDGSDVLLLMRGLRIPCIAVLHTVTSSPTPHQRAVLEAVIDRAASVVTMTSVARDKLVSRYDVDPTKVVVISHGAPDIDGRPKAPGVVFRGASRTVLTWGLLGPGKGIEWGIDAMHQLSDLVPAVQYVVAGQTHPKVVAHEGEVYRAGLAERIRRRGLAASVRMDGRYLDASTLADLIASADVVLLPYDSVDQVTSGVLIEAVAAGKPVVATAFPHAIELLSGGAGLVVAHQDPAAIAHALRTILTRVDVAARMSGRAAATAPSLRWSSVAALYEQLATRLVAAALAA